MKTYPDNTTRRIPTPWKLAIGIALVLALLLVGLRTKLAGDAPPPLAHDPHSKSTLRPAPPTSAQSF